MKVFKASSYDERQMLERYKAAVLGFIVICALLVLDGLYKVFGYKELFEGAWGNIILPTIAIVLVFIKMNVKDAINYDNKANLIFPLLSSVYVFIGFIHGIVKICSSMVEFSSSYIISDDIAFIICWFCWFVNVIIAFTTIKKQKKQRLEYITDNDV